MPRRSRIARIDPLSAARVYGAMTAVIGLIIGAFVSLFAVLGASLGESVDGPFAVVVGVGAIVALPLIYGLIGFVMGAFQSWVYNVFAGLVGGIAVDLADEDAE